MATAAMRPFRADHVGSLLRPPELLQARNTGAPPERLREIEERHIRRVIERQRDLGLDVVTDGELRRRNFMSDLIEAVDGFDTGDAVARMWSAAAGGAAAGAGAGAPAPSSVTLPWLGCVSPVTMRSRVLLPAPLSPRMT
jgi:5-methyltetrahydropteroyltriglutamate--homocysteine methyltransferase